MVKLFENKMTKKFVNNYLLDLFDSNFVSIFEEKKTQIRQVLLSITTIFYLEITSDKMLL